MKTKTPGLLYPSIEWLLLKSLLAKSWTSEQRPVAGLAYVHLNGGLKMEQAKTLRTIGGQAWQSLTGLCCGVDVWKIKMFRQKALLESGGRALHSTCPSLASSKTANSLYVSAGSIKHRSCRTFVCSSVSGKVIALWIIIKDTLLMIIHIVYSRLPLAKTLSLLSMRFSVWLFKEWLSHILACVQYFNKVHFTGNRKTILSTSHISGHCAALLLLI